MVNATMVITSTSLGTLQRTEDEDDGIMVLAPMVDTNLRIVCDERAGDDW